MSKTTRQAPKKESKTIKEHANPEQMGLVAPRSGDRAPQKEPPVIAGPWAAATSLRVLTKDARSWLVLHLAHVARKSDVLGPLAR